MAILLEFYINISDIEMILLAQLCYYLISFYINISDVEAIGKNSETCYKNINIDNIRIKNQ